jgi:exopolysaccharide biosynthesis polyprenyl glycosylphosphotransferase
LDPRGQWDSRAGGGTEFIVGEAAETARPSQPDGARTAVGGRPADVASADLRSYVLRRVFAFSDLLALSCALVAAYAVQMLAGRPAFIEDVWVIALLIPLWVPIGLVSGLYHADVAGRSLLVTTADELGPVFRTATIWSWLVLVARVAVHSGWLEFLPSLSLWALGIPLVLGLRLLTRRLARQRRWYAQKTVLVGPPAERARVVARIERHPEWGLRLAGQVNLPPTEGLQSLGDAETGDAAHGPNGGGVTGAGPYSELVDLAISRGASRVIFTASPESLEDRSMRELTQAGIHVDIIAGDSDVLSPAAHLSQLEGLPVLSISPELPPRFWGVVKRGVDLLIAVPALILTLPLLAYCALRIKLDSPGPVFFRQERAGRDQRHFRFLKLRTMSRDAEDRKAEVAALNMHGGGLESGMFKAISDPRVTRAGASLRRHSLDELPQLWNVVKGDMSLVGPRPLPLAEDARVPSRYELRYSMRPGMTGPWQVLGRSDIPLDEMLKLDYGYVLNWSFVEDLKLLLQTAAAVINGRGAY